MKFIIVKGLYLYNSKKHDLKQILNKYIHSLTGKQKFVSEAPVNLIYIADLSTIHDATAE